MALAAAVIVVGLLLVTAIASRKPLSGEGQTVPPVGGGQSQINAPPWALALVAAGALVALVGILVTVDWPLLRRRKKDDELVREFRISRTAKFVALLVPFVLGAVLVAAAIEGSRARTPIKPSGNVVPRAGRAPKPGHFSSYTPPTWILPTVVGIVLLGAGAVLLVVAYRGRLGQGAEHAPDVNTAALSEAVRGIPGRPSWRARSPARGDRRLSQDGDHARGRGSAASRLGGATRVLGPRPQPPGAERAASPDAHDSV